MRFGSRALELMRCCSTTGWGLRLVFQDRFSGSDVASLRCRAFEYSLSDSRKWNLGALGPRGIPNTWGIYKHYTCAKTPMLGTAKSLKS